MKTFSQNQPPATTLTRRGFLRRSAVATFGASAPWIIPSSVLGLNGAVPPSERLTIGQIGVGVMGGIGVMGPTGRRGGHLRVLNGRPDVQLLAVCDVDRERRNLAKVSVDETYAAERGTEKYSGCTAYNDYREMLARADIDAVLIATPDHWHTPMAVHAAKAGKDVYCEKPVSMTIDEGRRLVETVRRYGTVFQTGTQYRSIPRIRRVCEFVRSGGLGRIKSVFTIWSRYGIPKTGPSMFPLDPALPAEPVPDGLDWDMWVGPALWRPYNKLYHRNPPPGVVPWVFCDAFGLTAITGYHSHAADVIQYAIGMETSGPVEIIHPSSGEFPTLTCRYANGVLLHHVENWNEMKRLYNAVPESAPIRGSFGGLFVGERGWITSMSGISSGELEAEPRSLFHEMKLASREESHQNNHHSNWFECIRNRTRPSCHEEIGHRGASLGHLVMTSYKLGRSLKWDPAKEEFIGDETANRLRSRAMRQPWTL